MAKNLWSFAQPNTYLIIFSMFLTITRYVRLHKKKHREQCGPHSSVAES